MLNVIPHFESLPYHSIYPHQLAVSKMSDAKDHPEHETKEITPINFE